MSRNLLYFSIAVTVFASTHLAAADDWPQWLGPDRDNSSSETGLLEQWPTGGPERLWLFRDCGKGYSGPAVVGNRLYIMGARDDATYLICLDIENGEEVWAAEMGPRFENRWGDGPRGTPAVDGKLVYALSAYGDLICTDAASGEEVWRTSMKSLGGSTPNWGYAESVLVDGQKVLCTPGGDQGAIAALDRLTGRIKWQSTELDDDAHYSSIIKANVQGQPQYIQLLPHRLIGLAQADGRLLWEASWPGGTAIIPTPIFHDGLVYASSGYGIGCMLVEPTTNGQATKVYENKVMKNKHDGLVLLDDHIYGYSNGVGWVCQNFYTGEQVWRERGALGKGAVTYADGMLYCVSQDEGVVALVEATPAGWNERGRFTLSPQTEMRSPSGRIWTYPVVANGRLYLRDQDLVYCYDIRQ